jgi:hypothetical protein
MTTKDYDADLDTRSYSRLYREESAIAFSAMDTVLNGEKGVYASSALTSGERAYSQLKELGFAKFSELDEPHRTALLKGNVEGAVAFARRLRDQLKGELVISPGPYSAPGWTQAEYLDFWEQLIRTRVKAVYFNEGWEYSNGCTFEFAIALERGVPTFDSRLQPLSAEVAILRVESAARDVQGRGFDPQQLRTNLERIRQQTMKD